MNERPTSPTTHNRSRITAAICLVAATWLTAGCASPDAGAPTEPPAVPPAGNAQDKGTPAKPAPAHKDDVVPLPPETVHAGDLAADYHVLPMDVLKIHVYGETDISRDYQVSEAGAINHPFLGSLVLEGLTLIEARQRVTELLARDFLVDPKVAITVTSSVGRRIILFGEVGQPGAYTIPPDQPMSLLNAVSLAGGFSELAALGRVRIVRKEEGEERVIKVDVSDLLAGKAGSQDVPLKPGDVITVAQSRF